MENEHIDSPKFRYREQMERLSAPCPPDDFAPRETVAFRWVIGDIADERNFLPQFFKNPERFNEKEDKLKCLALGLSLFDSALHAQRQFASVRKLFRKGPTKLGTHLAQGTILPGFGVSDLPNETGHFTFHPFESIELKEHFTIISLL